LKRSAEAKVRACTEPDSSILAIGDPIRKMRVKREENLSITIT
jgi:carbonic anhydrase/acetyltransferase-like protein (isoleucine patch superfamily)